MTFILFLKAVVIGVSIAAPVGPIGILCMQRTLKNGIKAGFLSGLGAATADAIYGAIGVFGLTAITSLFTALSTPLAWFSGVFLTWMGIQLLKPSVKLKKAHTMKELSSWKAFGSTMGLTLANPITIVSFIAVFSALSAKTTLDALSSSTMVVGVFIGSAAWWLVLALCVARLQDKISDTTMLRINQIAGVTLIGFGVWQLQNHLL